MALITHLVAADDNSELDEKLQQAESYFQNQKFDKSIELYLKLIEKDPNNPKYHSIIGSVYNYLKNHEKAIYHVDKAIELDEENLMHYVLRSMITDDFSEQESWLMRALEKDPQHDASVAILISMYAAKAISEEAICNYKKALESVLKGSRILKEYINVLESSPNTKDPQFVAMLPKLKERLVGKVEMETELRKKLDKKLLAKIRVINQEVVFVHLKSR